MTGKGPPYLEIGNRRKIQANDLPALVTDRSYGAMKAMMLVWDNEATSSTNGPV